MVENVHFSIAHNTNFNVRNFWKIANVLIVWSSCRVLMLFCTVISVNIETVKYHCTKVIEKTSFIIEPFIFITYEFSAQLYHLKIFKTNPLGLRNNSLNCCWLPVEAHFLSLSLSSLDFFFFFFSVIRNNSVD